MNIRIIGAGWYGCYIGMFLMAKGHEVTIFEKEAAPFLGASGFNQSRLHLGFHYPRSQATRSASYLGYKLFHEIYPSLIQPVLCNIYCIAQGSLIDFKSYLAVLDSYDAPYFEINPKQFGLQNVEGAIQTPEYVILQAAAQKYFQAVLKDNLVCDAKIEIDSNTHSDWTIDCTFGAFGCEGIDVYEPCIMHLYNGPGTTAITMMDGPFGSLYPWQGTDMISLTAVQHTPMGKVKTYEEARYRVNEFKGNHALVEHNRNEMEKVITAYVPWFHEKWKWEKEVYSIRGVPFSRADSRQCIVTKADDRLISVQPGKIDAIFSAAQRVENIITPTPV